MIGWYNWLFIQQHAINYTIDNLSLMESFRILFDRFTVTFKMFDSRKHYKAWQVTAIFVQWELPMRTNPYIEVCVVCNLSLNPLLAFHNFRNTPLDLPPPHFEWLHAFKGYDSKIYKKEICFLHCRSKRVSRYFRPSVVWYLDLGWRSHVPKFSLKRLLAPSSWTSSIVEVLSH